MNTLFGEELPESLSPKLAWLRKHGITTKERPALEFSLSMSDHPKYYPWVCGALDGMVEPYGVGETEDDAIWDYCHKNDLTHYSLE